MDKNYYDPVEKRTSLKAQIKFIDKTEFQLVTNKSNTTSNQFIKKLAEYQKGKLTVGDLKSYLKILCSPKTGKDTPKVDKYISTLESQAEEWLQQFLNKLRIEHNKDDLIECIKLRIKEKNVKHSRIDDVFASIDSHLKTLIYEDVKARRKVLFTFDEYDKHFTRFFEWGRSIKLPIILGDKKVSLPKNPEKYTFIKQLIDIEIISQLDNDFEDSLISVFTSKYEMHNNLFRWLQQDEITEDVIRQFDEETILIWTNIFGSIYNKLRRKLRRMPIEQIDQDELLDLASQCYFEALKLNLSIDETSLNTSMSNGQFYLLSDIPVLGWDIRWKERYLNE